MSGTVVQTASSVCPRCPTCGGHVAARRLLSGSHELKVWYGGADKLRLALLGRS